MRVWAEDPLDPEHNNIPVTAFNSGNSFTSISEPNSDPNDGTYSGITITDFSASGETMSFDLNIDTTLYDAIINIDPDLWYYGPVLVSSSENRQFLISNLGVGTLEVSNIDFTGADANLFSIESGDAPISLNTGDNHYMEVSFTPDSEGEKSAIMQLSNNDPNHNPLNVQLSGTGTTVPHPVINVDPGYWDYGLVPLGENRGKIYYINNNAPPGSGQDLIGVMSIVTNDNNFTINSGDTNFYMMPGAQQQITIGFHAYAEPGVKNAILRFDNNDPNSDSLKIPITGTALGADIVVEPLSWDYDSVNIGTGLEKIFHISNSGNDDLTIDSMSITSNQFDFTYGYYGQPITLESNATIAITVRFHPTSTVENVDSLIINSNDYDENRIVIVLRGTGALSSVDEIPSYIVSSFTLYQNHPNPFNPVTTIRYDLPEQSHITITIYDLLGRQVKTLINQTQDAGYR